MTRSSPCRQAKRFASRTQVPAVRPPALAAALRLVAESGAKLTALTVQHNLPRYGDATKGGRRPPGPGGLQPPPGAKLRMLICPCR